MKKQICIPTNKIRYPTQQRAEDHIKSMRKSFQTQSGRTAPTRSYECSECKGWHTASQTVNNSRFVVNKEAFEKFILKENGDN